MNYASFYGGQPGISFVITQHFPSIETMKEKFKYGDVYTEVNYGEYVIIDTKNKNDPDNGKVYRRGYDYSNEKSRGAIYIGQIVGPSGLAPALKMKEYSNMKTEIDKMSEEEQKINHFTSGELTIDTNDLVPGKNPSDGTFNDSIKWISYTIREADNTDAEAYIGFQIPYTYIEATSASTTPYDTNGQYKDKLAVYRDDDLKHPFYRKFHFVIPKGIKGDAIKNLRTVTVTENLQVEGYNITADKIGKEILVYTYYNYDNQKDGNPKNIYLGDYNIIKEILLEDDGTLTIKYTNQEDTIFSNKVKWIDNINIDLNGNITTVYNTGEIVPQKAAIVFPQTILFDKGDYEGEGTQTIKVQYSNTKKEVISPPINYIMKADITSDNHLVLLHSDPKRRQSFIANGDNKIWKNRNDWQDLGSVKDDDGILIGLNFNLEDYPSQLGTIENCIAFLNKKYPSGLPTGKIVTIGNSNTNKSFYGFNYTLTKNGTTEGYVGWYYLGTFSNELLVVGDDTEEIRAQAGNLMTGGVWFVTEEI